jgi:hypothetical protein
MKLFTKKTNWFIFLFFIIFTPHVSIFNLTIKTVYLFVVIPSILGFIKYMQNNIVPKYIKLTIFLMLFSLFYNLIMYFLHGFVDISWIIKILMGFIEFYAAIFIGNIYIKLYGNEAVNKIIVHLFYIGVIHSILLLIIFISPSFRNIFYSVIMLTELAYSSTFRLDNQTRFSGLLNTGFGSLSILNAIMFLMGLYSYMINNKITLTKFVIGTLLLFISSILSGRIGIVIMLLALAFFYVLPMLKFSILNKKIKLLLIIIPIIIIFVIFLNIYFPDKALFAFETFFKYLDSGTFDNSTELILAERLNSNLTYLELIFGTGNYIIDYADSGYIVMMNGGGFIGVIISYSFLFSIIYLNPTYINSREKYKYIFITLILIMFFINYKNLYFFGYNDIFQIYFLITCTAALLEIKNKSLII